jgi:hypothetical protein
VIVGGDFPKGESCEVAKPSEVTMGGRFARSQSCEVLKPRETGIGSKGWTSRGRQPKGWDESREAVKPACEIGSGSETV